MGKIIKNVILTLLILTLCASTAFLAYLHFFAGGDERLEGEWTAELDMAPQAAAEAFCWLRGIESVSVSMEEMEAYMQNLTIQVNLTMEQDSRTGGSFRCNILPESYDACRQAAYEAFAQAFRDLLAQRLHMADYTGATDREALEELMTETFGMSTVSYLAAYGPALLPPLEDLQARYDGSGTFETAEGVLIRRFDAGGLVSTRVERYIREGSVLVLTGEVTSVPPDASPGHYPVVYTLILQN